MCYPSKNKQISSWFWFSPWGLFSAVLVDSAAWAHELVGGNAQPEMQRGGKNGGGKVGGRPLPGGAICLRHPTSSHPQLYPLALTAPTWGGLSLLCPASPRGDGLWRGMVTNCAVSRCCSRISCTVPACGPIAPIVQNLQTSAVWCRESQWDEGEASSVQVQERGVG